MPAKMLVKPNTSKKVATKKAIIKKNGKKKVVLKNAKTFITNSSLRRMAQRSDIERIKNDVYECTREKIADILNQVSRTAVLQTLYHERSTVTADDVYNAFRSLNMHVSAGINKNTKHTFKTCSSSRKKKVGKARRSKSGTETRRNIIFQKKNSDYFAIPRANFSRLVRSIVSKLSFHFENNVSFRFDRNSIDLIQLATENIVIDLLTNSNHIATFAGRKTVERRDVELTSHIMTSLLL